MNPGITWMLQHYEPGIEIPGTGVIHACKKCGALGLDSGDALERHVKWHKDQAPSATINLTTMCTKLRDAND